MTEPTDKTDKMIRKEHDLGQTLESLIAEMTEAGYGSRAIAAKLGVSLVTYYSWLAKLGAEFSQHRTVTFSPREASIR